MDAALISSATQLSLFQGSYHGHKISGFQRRIVASATKMLNGRISCNGSHRAGCRSAASVGDMHGRSSLESLFCYNKANPNEIIEKPVGLSIAEKLIGENLQCPRCHAKGAVLCITCSGSGLYVDSILESQGIMVKVRCLGCGGTGNIMCAECGGRAIGLKLSPRKRQNWFGALQHEVAGAKPQEIAGENGRFDILDAFTICSTGAVKCHNKEREVCYVKVGVSQKMKNKARDGP
ncbi:hypothetical protein Nepgr_030937 [Nepenthes gracilis]|uniref:Uncharacterized protein n=1 Tax=Nepenthes gracilis TaxID=150966 RepID=A0AAD3TH49_NEPGR|nr:hypothetical protein Nepgr_030937 [Nepenthes gracilis]